jgi:arsenate reductase
MYPEVAAYMTARAGEFEQIGATRRKQLARIAALQRRAYDARGEYLPQIYLCVQDARRSPLAALWTQLWALHYGLPPLPLYSAGTAPTALHPLVVDVLVNAGLRVAQLEEGRNPRFAVRWNDNGGVRECYAKTPADEALPPHRFLAINTCAPTDGPPQPLPGAFQQFELHYADPGAREGTPYALTPYEQVCAQISREAGYFCALLAESAPVAE